MVLPPGKREREYQFFKDTEIFGNLLAGTTAGSIVLNTPTPKVGDLFIFNSGSTDVYYNLWTSGVNGGVSTSGTLLEAGAKIVYTDVGFDVIGLITVAGVSKVYAQKIYSSR